MSETRVVMKFECLPNEILIECFDYLNKFDIFDSFDTLNYRFNELIRNIPLHLNFEHIRKLTFDQFCINMLLNSEIKKQILSLHLSNNSTYDQIDKFLSQFSLDKFSHLRSLKLIRMNKTNMSELVKMLPLLSNLRYFYFTSESCEINDILAALPMSKMQTLAIPTVSSGLSIIPQFLSMTRLTISRCCLAILCQFFKNVPMLEYLKVEALFKSWRSTFTEQHMINEPAVSDRELAAAAHLKQLIVNDFTANFDSLERILKQAPNLKSLTMCASNNSEIINACRWQQLITSLLPHLHIFKFKFSVEEYVNEDSDICHKFQEFQTEFWHTHHHWNTEWELNKCRASIYSIPYFLHEYTLEANNKTFYGKSIPNSNTFGKITNLTLCTEQITENCESYFSNVISLKLENNIVNEDSDHPFLKTKHIRCLKRIINLDNLIDLDISLQYRLKSPSVLLQILKEAPQLSFLKIEVRMLISLFNNRELCKYFKKMIRKLDVVDVGFVSLIDYNMMMKICEIFSNIEQYRCDVKGLDDLLLILNVLSKLSSMTLFSFRGLSPRCRNRLLADHTAELNTCSFATEFGKCNYHQLNYYTDPLDDIHDDDYDSPYDNDYDFPFYNYDDD